MDKTAIKNFAVRARNKLIEQVKQKAFEIGIEEDNIIEPQVEGSDSVIIHNKHLDQDEIRQRNRLINEIEQKGYEQVMEEVAYTWFNRFVALRFMEVNGYLPTGVRVLSSETERKVEPDIIAEALNIDLDIDQKTVYKYQDNNDTDGLYKYLLIKQCNSLNDIMPFIFEKIADYTEILLPNNLLSEGSVIRDMVENIDEENWHEVEIIGWMYQFYISEKKDEVFASKEKIKKEEIPAATQLFTPDWIVKYMVENSLGRYWLESNPNNNLKEKWEYYLEEPEQESEVKEKLEEIRDRDISPEEITVLDPACGSGHILVYAFDVLHEIYKSAGYMESDIPQLILNNNLYGLEICDRAGQLASLSVVMKAREKDSRIFEKEVNLNICSIQETNRISNKVIELLVDNIEDNGKKNIIEKDLKYLLDVYVNGKMYGSIINVKQINLRLIDEQIEKIKSKKVSNLFDIPNKEVILELLPKIIKQAKIMNQKYDIVVTNPPYMGRRSMSSKLRKIIDMNYPNCKKDLFAVFIKTCFNFNDKNCYTAMITQHSWMFLSSYDQLRDEILDTMTINTMVHLGANAFKEISGEVVQTVSFVIKNNNINNYNSKFVRLTNYSKAIDKEKNYFINENKYVKPKEDYKKIPGEPVAYWLSKKMCNTFLKGVKLSDCGKPCKGMDTGNNSRFLRYWYEVSQTNTSISFNNDNGNNKWFPYNKGGGNRKWYGNNYYVVDWANNGKELKAFKKSNLRNKQYYFKPGLTWSTVSTQKFGIRRFFDGFLFDNGGCCFFTKKQELDFYLALLNSKIITLIESISPTLNYQPGQLGKFPVIKPEDMKLKEYIIKVSQENIEFSRTDWDSFETSWDFKEHPLLTHKKGANTIKEAFNNWSEFAEDQFYQLKENEEELNRIFIDIYGLEDELTPEVDEDDVTIRKADRARDIRSFMSYAVGCMVGRYSLDEEGLVYAGGEFDESRYETFKVDSDGIIPILDDEYFDDDIVAKFVEFVKVTFGEEHLEENLEYIADALIEGGTSSQDTARETIRRYFLFDFIKDHNKIYNKRPIYWLFQSDGRGKAFNALIYMHRYDSGTVARVRTDYLHELQKKIEAEKVRLQGIIDSDLSTREKNKAKKRLKKLDKHTEELIKYDEVLNHVANQQIEIDLDDGVKENYAKFDDVLRRI